MKNSREMGTLRVERMHPGVHWFGVDISMPRCAYLRSGSDQVFGGGGFFRVERFGWHRDLDVKWDAYP